MIVIPNNVKLTLPLKWLSLGDLLLADQMKAKNARQRLISSVLTAVVLVLFYTYPRLPMHADFADRARP